MRRDDDVAKLDFLALFALTDLGFEDFEDLISYDAPRTLFDSVSVMGLRCRTFEDRWEVGIFDMLPESCGR